ncbi:aldehyde dehydrogenase family protein [Nocardiopsis metallicus]|nr:aldehyde dehydrogenase family protein [Nocardiopsis metallicus]
MVVENGTSLIRHEPVGVCVGITPWNYPLVKGSRP